LKLCLEGTGVEVISAKGTGKALDSGLGEGERDGALQDGVEFADDFVGETRGAIAFVTRE